MKQCEDQEKEIEQAHRLAVRIREAYQIRERYERFSEETQRAGRAREQVER